MQLTCSSWLHTVSAIWISFITAWIILGRDNSRSRSLLVTLLFLSCCRLIECYWIFWLIVSIHPTWMWNVIFAWYSLIDYLVIYKWKVWYVPAATGRARQWRKVSSVYWWSNTSLFFDPICVKRNSSIYSRRFWLCTTDTPRSNTVESPWSISVWLTNKWTTGITSTSVTTTILF